MAITEVRTLQQHLGLNRVTQRALAARAGISESAISHYVAGRKRPTAGTVDRLEQALDLLGAPLADLRSYLPRHPVEPA